MNTSRVLVLLLAIAFALTITVSLASADYVVIKDKKGICMVIESNHQTPKTIEGGGPFKTKEEAVRVKESKCAAAKIRETPPGPTGEVRGKSEQREEKIRRARELKEEKAKQKTTLKDQSKQSLKEKREKAKQPAEEKPKKESEEQSKPKTSQ